MKRVIKESQLRRLIKSTINEMRNRKQDMWDNMAAYNERFCEPIDTYKADYDIPDYDIDPNEYVDPKEEKRAQMDTEWNQYTHPLHPYHKRDMEREYNKRNPFRTKNTDEFGNYLSPFAQSDDENARRLGRMNRDLEEGHQRLISQITESVIHRLRRI